MDGTRWRGGGWKEVDGRWMGGGCGKCGECLWVHQDQTVMTPLYEDAPRKSKNLPSRGVPGRFLSLVLI